MPLDRQRISTAEARSGGRIVRNRQDRDDSCALGFAFHGEDDDAWPVFFSLFPSALVFVVPEIGDRDTVGLAPRWGSACASTIWDPVSCGDERAADPCARRGSHTSLPRRYPGVPALGLPNLTWPRPGAESGMRPGRDEQSIPSVQQSVNSPPAIVREAIVSEMHRGLTVMLPPEFSGSNLTLGTALGVPSWWKPHARTRSLRELSDFPATAGTSTRNIRCF